MTPEDARDETEFVTAAAKLSGIKLPSNGVISMYALLYEAARRAPDDEELFLDAAAECFRKVNG